MQVKNTLILPIVFVAGAMLASTALAHKQSRIEVSGCDRGYKCLYLDCALDGPRNFSAGRTILTCDAVVDDGTHVHKFKNYSGKCKAFNNKDGRAIWGVWSAMGKGTYHSTPYRSYECHQPPGTYGIVEKPIGSPITGCSNCKFLSNHLEYRNLIKYREHQITDGIHSVVVDTGLKSAYYCKGGKWKALGGRNNHGQASDWQCEGK